jgi:hypothetical protein
MKHLIGVLPLLLILALIVDARTRIFRDVE